MFASLIGISALVRYFSDSCMFFLFTLRSDSLLFQNRMAHPALDKRGVHSTVPVFFFLLKDRIILHAAAITHPVGVIIDSQVPHLKDEAS